MSGYTTITGAVITPTQTGFVTPGGNVILPNGGGGFVTSTGHFVQTH
jgi:hypothetical protein